MRSDRQQRAAERLEAQLKAGTKTEKKSLKNKVPLTDGDVNRINKELDKLRGRA